MKKKSIVTIIILVMLTTAAYSAIYYVDGNLAVDCDGTAFHYDVATRARVAGPGQIAWPKVGSANLVLAASDTVYMRGGTYLIGKYDWQKHTPDEGIRPLNSGTDASNRITYATYQTEKVNFVGNALGGKAIDISGKNWIKITGYDGSTSEPNMKFSNVQMFVWISDYPNETGYPYGTGSNYNEIAYCEFTQQDKTTIDNEWDGGSKLQHNSSYNWIHHCQFHQFGANHIVRDISYCLNLGWEDCGTGEPNSTCHDNSSYNVIENNEFYHAGHHTVLLLNPYNVLRNNILHNEQWTQGSDGIWYGYRVINMHGVYNEDQHLGYNLVEANRISHATNNMNTSLGGEGIHLGTSNNIIRYNDFYANGLNQIYLENHRESTTGRINYNHIYNNTFFANGYGATFPGAPPQTFHAAHIPDRCIFYFVSGTADAADVIFAKSMYGNVVKNNLSWKNESLFAVSGRWSNGANWGFAGCAGSEVCGDTVFEHNFNATGAEVDPKFVSEGSYSSPVVNTTDVEWYWHSPSTPDGSDITTINTEPNFNLQSSSSAKDGGNYLTQANGSGSNSTALIVDDAKYFQPGWGNGAGGGASVQADSIAIGAVSKVVQISSINYDTKTITLTSPMTWSNDAPVWLYKNSTGQVVLRGSAPDIGAHEYVPAQPQTWSLNAGWSWISFNVLPADLSLNSIFSNILGQIEQLKTQTQSAIHSNSNWKGDLADMSGIGQYKMFKVKVSSACTLTVTGTTILSSTPILLTGGWNWVAYLPTTTMPIATALDSIKGQVLQVKSFTQSATYNSTSWSGIFDMQPGQGYAIKMSAPGTLIYPGGQ